MNNYIKNNIKSCVGCSWQVQVLERIKNDYNYKTFVNQCRELSFLE